MPGINELRERYRLAEARLFAHYGLSVTQHWIEFRDPALRFRVLDIGTGPPVVLIGGIGAPPGEWAEFAAALPGRRLLLLEPPGHGLSDPFDWPGPPARVWATRFLTAAADQLDISRAPFIGNSLGGMFSLWFAVDAPDRVSGVVALGEPAVALPGARGILSMGIMTAPVLGAAFAALPRLPAPRAAVRAGVANAVGRPGVERAPDEFVDVHALGLRLPGQARSFRSLLRRLLRGRAPRPEAVLTDDELRGFEQPALFLWGDEDVFLSPAGGQRSVDLMPNARLVAMPGGHLPWFDQPDWCAREVNAFLAAL